MSIINAKLAEYILSVGVDSVETGEALGGNFLGGHAKGDVLKNFSFRLSKFYGFFLQIVTGKEHIGGMLTDVSLTKHCLFNTFTNFKQRGILKKNTRLWDRSQNLTDERNTEVFTEEHELSSLEPLAEDYHITGIIQIEKSIIEDNQRLRIFLQSVDKFNFISYNINLIMLHLL